MCSLLKQYKHHFEKQHMTYYLIFMDCQNQIKINETQWEFRSMSLTSFKDYITRTQYSQFYTIQ